MSRPISILPRLSARPTVPTPPPSYEQACAEAQARLDAAVLDEEAGNDSFQFPPLFSAPCALCGHPRLSAIETLCPNCETDGAA